MSTLRRSLCSAETSTPLPASPSLLRVSARGPDSARSCCQDWAYCRRTSSIIVDVRAKPIKMYTVHINMYFGLSGKSEKYFETEHLFTTKYFNFTRWIKNDYFRCNINNSKNDSLTRDNISESNSGHGDETKIESVVKTPIVFPHLEQARPSWQVQEQKTYSPEGI